MQYAPQNQYNQYGSAYTQPTQPAYQYPQQYYSQSQGQPQYSQPQGTPYGGQLNTPQYAGAVPFPSPYAAPTPLQQPQPQAQRPPRTNTPHPHRRHTSAGNGNGNGTARPLRSVLRNGERTNGATGAIPLSRSRTHSGGAENRVRVNSMTRSRTTSSTRPDPDHIFLSIGPPNELDMSNIAFQSTIEELSEKVFPMWPPGIVHQQRHGHNWHVRFSGAPWNGSGDDSILASRMICMIFWVLAHQGYVYLTSINTGRALKPPRLVFIRAPSDALAHFFTMTLSNSGDQVTFVNPPAIVTQTLGLTLRAAFPRRIANEHASDDGIFTIQLKSGFSGPGVDKDMFLAHILKHINDCAFKLDASVPMARRGLFGLGGRKELWVFKGSETWWQTRK